MPEDEQRRNPALEELLEPSLQEAESTEPIYSIFSNVMVAFFGGVYAILLYLIPTTRRLGERNREMTVIVILGLIWTAVLVWYGYHNALGFLPGFMDLFGKPSRTLRYAARFGGLLLYGLFFLHYKKYYKAMQMGGLKSPKPWGPAIASLVASWVLSIMAAGFGHSMAEY
jgi:hypothetical protein